MQTSLTQLKSINLCMQQFEAVMVFLAILSTRAGRFEVDSYGY